MTSSTAKGSCLCGAVRFTAALPPKWVAHCHCTRCRRAHGAAFVTWAGFDEASVAVSDAESLLRRHVAAEGGTRSFCGRCGSPMFFQSPNWPGELHIARALFGDVPGVEPQVHVHVDTRVDWVHLADDLPCIGD